MTKIAIIITAVWALLPLISVWDLKFRKAGK